MNPLRQDDLLRREDIENPNMDDVQTLSFAPSIDPETHLPYQSTKGLDETKDLLIVDEIETHNEPLFGEHLREARQIIKSTFKKK